MELVYLWVKKYKNIKEQGFNFSPKFTYSYDAKTKELIYKEEDYIKNFFDEEGKVNITAIVGENGSGKSSVLECLYSIINDKENINFEYILVYGIAEINYTSNITINTENTDITKRDIRQVECHIYSNDLIEYKNQIDIRKESVLKNLISNSLQNDFELTTFMYIPTSIEITNIRINDEFYEMLTFNPDNIHYDETLSSEENKRKTDELIDTLEYLRANIEKDYHKFLIILFIREQEFEDLWGLENINSLKEKLEESGIVYLDEEEFKRYFSMNNEAKSISELEDRDEEIYVTYSYLFTFDFIDSKNRRYNNLSHGERTIFGQFLSIYYLSMKRYVNNFLYLLDEAELSLHPNWQKQYLNEMILLLKNIKKKFYIIFSSHSPFILSDIPKQNVIFLKKEKNGNCKVVSHDEVLIKKQTFGANIHTLLSDSFFMNDGLMGEFAKSKITEIKEFYQKVEEKKKSDFVSLKKEYEKKKIKFEEIQSIIGELFLKTVIKNYLDDLEILFSDDNTLIDKELAEIEKRKAYLKGLKNDKA